MALGINSKLVSTLAQAATSAVKALPKLNAKSLSEFEGVLASAKTENPAAALMHTKWLEGSGKFAGVTLKKGQTVEELAAKFPGVPTDRIAANARNFAFPVTPEGKVDVARLKGVDRQIHDSLVAGGVDINGIIKNNNIGGAQNAGQALKAFARGETPVAPGENYLGRMQAWFNKLGGEATQARAPSWGAKSPATAGWGAPAAKTSMAQAMNTAVGEQATAWAKGLLKNLNGLESHLRAQAPDTRFGTVSLGEHSETSKLLAFMHDAYLGSRLPKGEVWDEATKVHLNDLSVKSVLDDVPPLKAMLLAITNPAKAGGEQAAFTENLKRM